MPGDAFSDLFSPLAPDDDDGPELHIAGLSGDDLGAWFALLGEHGADYGDSLVWLYDEQRDALVGDVTDVARAIVEARASATPCVEALRIAGTIVPGFAFFAYAERIELFWSPSIDRWTSEGVEAFVELLRRYRARIHHARFVPDGRFVAPLREEIARALAGRLGADAVALS